MASVIGIDLGTSFSAIATIDEAGRPVIVANLDGSNITPSCVVATGADVMEVGEFARRQWGNAPDTAAARFKRDMGTSTTHSISGREFTPTQLSSFVLKKLLSDAEQVLGNVSDAVVTIPANFANEAREATMSAAKAAGLNVRFIINEPTAAALYYAYQSGQQLNGTYAIYDLGGGTFDISIIKVRNQDVSVLATNGVVRLGGDDFDTALQALVARKFRNTFGKELDLSDFTKNQAEEEKKSLSARKQITARVARQLVDISREEFEESISALITQAEMLCEATIEEAGVAPSDINGVFLVGGSTRVPLVVESVARAFRQQPISAGNVDEVVALGAALYAAYKGDQNNLTPLQKAAITRLKVNETTSKSFGTIAVEFDSARDKSVARNTVLIRKGERIPFSVTESFYTMHDGQRAVSCKVTESTAPETDPRFVKIIWEGNLELPPDRPASQEIQVTFAYDENQIMKCSFLDVGTGRESRINLSMTDAANDDAKIIEQFLVE